MKSNPKVIADNVKPTSYQTLYKKIDATSKTRFQASRRMIKHNKLSTLIVVLLSLGLILQALMDGYSISDPANKNFSSLVQVFSSIAVLVYSLLIAKNDYSGRAGKLYSCASALGDLKLKVHPEVERNKQEEYQKSSDAYQAILDQYEVHAIDNFQNDYTMASLTMPESYPLNWLKRIYLNIKYRVLYALEYSPYLLIILVQAYFIYKSV
ncbi:SLATT domain-containing protein [Shewanella vesiculosa]|uniref:SLATT domain-containing protein n=1 Tax=Shewanella vesiculosa TaxID=518738 RepID=A0ABV0FVS6_9GAMM